MTTNKRPSALGPGPDTRRINTENPDEVYDLAVVLQNAGPRLLEKFTYPEQRAVCRMLRRPAPIASQSPDYLQLIAAKAPAAEIQARLEALAHVAGVKLT